MYFYMKNEQNIINIQFCIQNALLLWTLSYFTCLYKAIIAADTVLLILDGVEQANNHISKHNCENVPLYCIFFCSF